MKKELKICILCGQPIDSNFDDYGRLAYDYDYPTFFSMFLDVFIRFKPKQISHKILGECHQSCALACTEDKIRDLVIPIKGGL